MGVISGLYGGSMSDYGASIGLYRAGFSTWTTGPLPTNHRQRKGGRVKGSALGFRKKCWSFRGKGVTRGPRGEGLAWRKPAFPGPSSASVEL